MFTGLIRTQGTIRRVDQRGDCMMTIAMRDAFAVNVGDSIACNGICLTAVKVNDNEFKVSLSAETMNRSTARDWAVGTILNLEPSLSVGDAMGGHFVSGHVDGLALVTRAEPSGDSTIWEFEVPPSLARFIAPKGSVTLDGVSLTVNEVKDTMGEMNLRSATREPLAAGVSDEVAKGIRSPSTTFTVNIIPHTAKMTNFGRLAVGASVNLEIDMLARYVARLNERKLA